MRFLCFLCCLAVWTGGFFVLSGDVRAEGEIGVIGIGENPVYEGKVVHLKIGAEGLVKKSTFRKYRRALRSASEQKAAAVVVELDTPGGYPYETMKLISESFRDLEVPSFAFVNRQAAGAGAIVALGCDKIYMHPVSMIGSAGVVSADGQEIEPEMKKKVEAFMERVVTEAAKSKGHNPDVARAMMFRDQAYEFGDVVTLKEGHLLNLTGKQAVAEFQGKPLLAAGLVKSVEELLRAEKINAEVVEGK